MKYVIMWRAKLDTKTYGDWHFYSEHYDLMSAKRAAKTIKNHLGYKGGNVKIITEEV